MSRHAGCARPPKNGSTLCRAISAKSSRRSYDDTRPSSRPPAAASRSARPTRPRPPPRGRRGRCRPCPRSGRRPWGRPRPRRAAWRARSRRAGGARRGTRRRRRRDGDPSARPISSSCVNGPCGCRTACRPRGRCCGDGPWGRSAGPGRRPGAGRGGRPTRLGRDVSSVGGGCRDRVSRSLTPVSPEARSTSAAASTPNTSPSASTTRYSVGRGGLMRHDQLLAAEVADSAQAGRRGCGPRGDRRPTAGGPRASPARRPR